MQMDKETTQIILEEEVVETSGMSITSKVMMRWVAELSGTSTEGHSVLMSRTGATPDEAVRVLFEAMGDAGITL